MKNLPINSLPPLWWLRPWATARRLQCHLSAVNELLARNIQRADEASHMADLMHRERDKAIIVANKWRYKYEEQVNINFIAQEIEDSFGDTDYLR